MSYLNKSTINIQHQLASYCRNGELLPIEGARPERLPHYRRLVFNVVKGTMNQAFPISAGIIDDKVWEQTVHNFFMNHDAQTPQIWKLPGEFYEWALETKLSEKLSLPYLNDLLLFEWIEIEVHTMPDRNNDKLQANGDLLKDQLVINKDHHIIQLEYPVHLGSAKESIEKKGQYFVLIFRDQDDGSVQFVNLSILHAVLIEKLLSPDSNSVTQLIPEISTIFQIESHFELENALTSFLFEMKLKKFILGFAP